MECCSACAAPASVWKLEGSGYLLFAESHGLADVRLPWLNALSFRTHQSSAMLMSLNVGVNSQHELVIQVGIAHLSYCYVIVIVNCKFT